MIETNSVESKIINLIRKTVKLYLSNKQEKKLNRRVFRGRTASISAQFENAFGLFLGGLLPEKYSIFIDYPISYKSSAEGKKVTTSYPDLAIINNDKVLAGIIELKIDLGYLRPDWEKETKQRYNQMRKVKKVSYKTNIGDNAKSKTYEWTINNGKLPRAIVVLTGQNDHGRLRKFSKQKNCFILSKYVHPNDYKINKSNFKEKITEIIRNEDNKENWKQFAIFLDKYFGD